MLRSMGAGRQFVFIVLEFFCVRRQRVQLNGKVSASVNVVSGVSQGSV